MNFRKLKAFSLTAVLLLALLLAPVMGVTARAESGRITFNDPSAQVGQSIAVYMSITSGNSANVVKAIEAAREARMAVIGLTGKGGGRMASMCDYLFDVPHSHTPLIQEMHEAVMHLMCQLIDHYLFENVQALRGA